MATPNSYDVGDLIQLTGTFKNASGVLTDPTTVTCTVRDPAGTVTTPTATRASVGVWNATVDLTGAVAGVWWYRFAGTGAVQAAEESTFYVEASNVYV
jgi:hypothetical protein